MTRTFARRTLRIVLIGSALWAVFLLGSHVNAPTIEPDRSDCGASALSVNAEGSSIGGGEPRADQEAFDKACVDRASARIRLAVVPGSILAFALVVTLVERRRHRAWRRDTWGVVRPFD